jgi:endonuclease III
MCRALFHGGGLQVKPLDVASVLDKLEAHYGPQEPCWPVDPYAFLIWWHCGYPASDLTCSKGWSALKGEVGIEPRTILAASQARLAHALKAGGMVPELRAMRLQQIAQRVMNEFGGDLRAGLVGTVKEVRKALKRFPNIADPGADRILLFGDVQPVTAVPSNCPQVLVRIQLGQERENYGVNYREAQKLIEDEIPEQFAARRRAYLLLKHGQAVCKRSKPRCDECPVSAHCAYFAGKDRGRSRPASEKLRSGAKRNSASA